MRNKSISIVKILFVFIVVVICGFTGIVAFNYHESSIQVQNLKTFAQALVYTPENHLAQYKTCWGIIPTRCGQVLYFVTSLNRDQFQVKINQVFMSAGLPSESDGYTLLDINLVTKHKVSIDGRVDSLDREQTPEPTAYRWQSVEGGNYWVITFYETAKDGHVYKFDEKPIIGNIITIMLQTK